MIMPLSRCEAELRRKSLSLYQAGCDSATWGRAAIAFVGEQPGDQEDLQGRPFVGPAGQALNVSMEDAGVDRGSAYVPNAVKHFKSSSAARSAFTKSRRLAR